MKIMHAGGSDNMIHIEPGGVKLLNRMMSENCYYFVETTKDVSCFSAQKFKPPGP